MFTFIKKNLQIWMRLSTFANEKERNLIDMCTFKNINDSTLKSELNLN